MYKLQYVANLSSLNSLVDAQVISKYLASKIAEPGLCKSHIRAAFQRGGHESLEEMLRENLTDALSRIHTHFSNPQ